MLNILRRSARVGLVTTTYPHEPEPAPDAFRGQVQLDAARCVGDGGCAVACPSAAIVVERAAAGWSWSLDDARCVFCGLCADACPVGAIALSTEFELATRDRSDLIARVTFAGEPRR